MPCATTSCLSTLQLSPIKPPNSLTKLSVSQSTTQRSPKDAYFNGGGDDDSSVVALPLPYHVKSITSPSNPFVKHCLKLRHSSSYRHSHASVLVVGTTPLRSPFQPQFLPYLTSISFFFQGFFSHPFLCIMFYCLARICLNVFSWFLDLYYSLLDWTMNIGKYFTFWLQFESWVLFSFWLFYCYNWNDKGAFWFDDFGLWF